MTENVQNMMTHIIGTCTDSIVHSWLQKSHPIQFQSLLSFLRPILEDLSTSSRDHIDIVFVGHARIVDQFMPAGGLVPAPNITDTILYSPWNCRIDANAAYAIAQGTIQAADRVFNNNRIAAYCQPIPSIVRWNSMRESQESLHNIPEILLVPVTREEEAWGFFHQLMQNRGVGIEGRVIIPYVVPEDQINAFGEIPLYMLVFATSFLLRQSNKTATVHLAASLDQLENARPVEWRTQYAYTCDGTVMTVDLGNRNVDPVLFTALRSLFDRNRR